MMVLMIQRVTLNQTKNKKNIRFLNLNTKKKTPDGVEQLLTLLTGQYIQIILAPSDN